MENIHPLQAFRERQHPPLSQEQLSELLGVGRVTVWRWETGARKVDEELLLKVSELTGIPARDLRPDLAKLFDDVAASTSIEAAE